MRPKSPKFKKFAELLENQIRRGEFSPGARLPSERILAQKYKLSHLTANKAVASLVAKGLLKRGLGRNGTFVVGSMASRGCRLAAAVIDMEMAAHSPFVTALPVTLQHDGFLPLCLDMKYPQEVRQQLAIAFDQELLTLVVDGHADFPYDVLEDIPDVTSLIFIDRFEGPQKYDASYILTDITAGAYEAAQQLLAHGCQRFLIVGSTRGEGRSSELFYKGAAKALEQAGIQNIQYIDAETVQPETYETLFMSENRPDAVLAFGDYLAVPVLAALEKLELSVPEDVAVIGYYNTPEAEVLGLTSLAVPVEQILGKVREALEQSVLIDTVFKPTLVFRNSCPEKSLEPGL